jgi:hypothetical protein
LINLLPILGNIISPFSSDASHADPDHFEKELDSEYYSEKPDPDPH